MFIKSHLLYNISVIILVKILLKKLAEALQLYKRSRIEKLFKSRKLFYEKLRNFKR